MTTVAEVEAALAQVVDPCSATTGSNLNIVEMGLVKSIEVDDGHVDVDMRLTSPACTMIPYFRKEARETVGELPGVDSVALETDVGLEWHSDMMTDEAAAKRQEVFEQQQAALDLEYPGRPDGADDEPPVPENPLTNVATEEPD